MTTKKGIITAAKMQGTVTVTVHQFVVHPIYKKRFRRSRKFLVDANGMSDLHVGDVVLIEECRPLSARKHFRIREVLVKAPVTSEVRSDSALEAVLDGAGQDELSPPSHA